MMTSTTAILLLFTFFLYNVVYSLDEVSDASDH
jgi:heme O synthase-like polyprenyltransferase